MYITFLCRSNNKKEKEVVGFTLILSKPNNIEQGKKKLCNFALYLSEVCLRSYFVETFEVEDSFGHSSYIEEMIYKFDFIDEKFLNNSCFKKYQEFLKRSY